MKSQTATNQSPALNTQNPFNTNHKGQKNARQRPLDPYARQELHAQNGARADQVGGEHRGSGREGAHDGGGVPGDGPHNLWREVLGQVQERLRQEQDVGHPGRAHLLPDAGQLLPRAGAGGGPGLYERQGRGDQGAEGAGADDVYERERGRQDGLGARVC